MQNKEFQDKMHTIQEKIGDEASNLILDEIGLLLTDNKNMNEQIENKNDEIKKLEQRNEALQRVNANLLQQVPMGDEEDLKPTEEKKKEPFDFKTVFDERGNFRK